ncbi:hypothetical protein EsH8_IV_000213 [Colletotrichum jinshuiense]
MFNGSLTNYWCSPELALEVIDKLAESGKHEIIGLIRKDPSSLPTFVGVKWVQTSYQDKSELVEILRGVHTVISFIVAHTDPGAETSKRLIDASIESGVKRFAPSEWASGLKLADVIEFTPWYANKLVVSKYLQDINKDKKVIEYTLFQVGGFTNYLAFPHQTAKHYKIDYHTFIDLSKHRGIILEGSENTRVTFTTIQDIAEVTARAIEYEGEWPTIGGINGQTLTLAELIRLLEEIQGKPFEIDRLKLEDLKEGIFKTDFFPQIQIPGISPEEAASFTKVVGIGMTVSTGQGAWEVSDEWNKIFPDFKPTGIKEFLQKTLGSK